MELQDLSQGKRSVKRRRDPDEPELLDELDAPSDGPSEASSQNDDPEAQESPEESFGGFASSEELLDAYTRTEELLRRKEREAEELREVLDSLEQRAGIVLKDVEDESFLREVRRAHEQDPVLATAMMIRRFQEDALNDVNERVEGRIRDERDFSRFLRSFLQDPSNTGLKAYEDELEFLIREIGLPPETAAALIRSIQEKRDATATKRSAAAKAIRNRAMVESAGEVGEPVDRDKEFDRILKKAKGLDDMFAGLRKFTF